MAVEKQLSRNLRKVCFRGCLPDNALRKQVSHSPEDIN